MKKYLVLFIAMLIILTGCFNKDTMQDINILTTIYPIEYVTKRLYGDNSNIKSIYPRGSSLNNFKATDKQLKDYSESDLFIYNGESKEREYATSMIKRNKSLKIIDASYGLEADFKDSDIWLNPSNMLMIAQNIKNELTDYLTDPYLIKDIEDKYNLLKVDITEFETELKKSADNSKNKTIVVADESLNFLNKYGFNVITLTKDGKNNENDIERVKKLFNDKQINYIFIMDNAKEYEIVKELEIDTLKFKTLDTISEKDEQENEDYLSIMYSNLDLIKQETYK